jgi:hypothetical protein
MQYGILENAIPVGDDGYLNKSDHLEWLEQRRTIEGSTAESFRNNNETARPVISESLPTSESTLSNSNSSTAPDSSLPSSLAALSDHVASTSTGTSSDYQLRQGMQAEELISLQRNVAGAPASSMNGLQYGHFQGSDPTGGPTSNNLLALNSMLAAAQTFPIQNPSLLPPMANGGAPQHAMPNPLVPRQNNGAQNPNVLMMLMNQLHQDPGFPTNGQGHLQIGQMGRPEPPSTESLPPWFPTNQHTGNNTAGDMAAVDFSVAGRLSNTEQANGPPKLPTVLFLDSDVGSLSDYQCFLRQQIEVFEASSDDVQYNASRMNRSIVLGQVGLRCRHCALCSEWERASGAVYYPGSLSMLYQAGQNMAKNHLCNGCKKIPQETRDLLNLLRGDKRRATAGKEYWSKTAQILGIFEDGKNGLKFLTPEGKRQGEPE